MSSFYPIQATFNRGEISPLLGSRADVDFWRQALKYCRNFQVLTHGGLRRRSGSKFITEVDDSAEVTRLFPFSFSETQSYVLEIGAGGNIRFLADRGVVESGGSPYTVSHSYASADIFRLSYTQFNDVAYFAHKSYAPQKLLRSAETSWTLSDAEFKDGPYLEVNTTGTTLTPAGTGCATPAMTSNTAPSGTVTDLSGSSTAYYAFDRDPETQHSRSPTSNTDWVVYDFGAGNEKTVDAYWIKGVSNANSPSVWRLEGWDGSAWVTLHRVDDAAGWTSATYKHYQFVNETAFQKYRLYIEDNNDGTAVQFSELSLHLAVDEQTAFNLTASAVTGINGDTGFQTIDVGRMIRLLGSDGVWRWAKIISRTSTTVVTIKIYGHALPDLQPITNWRLGAWSDETGWPGSVGLYDERLTWARTDKKPVTVYGSKQGDFEDYGQSDPLVETDAFEITLLSSNMNEILWLADDEDLITGSAKQVRSIGPADTTRSFSATNITQRKGPNSGASYIQPLSIGGVVLYVGAGGTKIRELVLGDQNRYVAPELSLIGEHYFKEGIVDWAFSEKPDPVIYAVTGDGLLVAITYDREQKVLGFSRHDFGGEVESVAVIPSTTEGYDDVYMVVKRTINGSTKRYIEVMEIAFDPQTDDVEDAFFVDCGLTYSGSSATTITGLDHLEGEEVVALAGGSVVRNLTVSSGQVTLPYAVTKAQIGLAMKSRAVTLPFAGPQRDGSLFGRRTNNVACFIDVYGAGALKAGAYAEDRWTPDLHDVLLFTGDELFGSEVELQSGFKRAEIEGSWAEGQGMVAMETDDPLPLIIRSLVFQNESEP